MPRSWSVKLHSRLTNSVIIHQADNYSPTLETGSLKCLMLPTNRGPEKCRPRSLNINTCGIKGRLRKRERASWGKRKSGKERMREALIVLLEPSAPD